MNYLYLCFKIWNPSGLPSLPNLLRYETFAVVNYGCMSHAFHLRQTRQSLNLGYIFCFYPKYNTIF